MNDIQPTLYFWVEGGSRRGIDEYHWLADCPWLVVEVSHGATCVSSDQPPTDARDAKFVSVPVRELHALLTLATAPRQPRPETTLSNEDDGRCLCDNCCEYMPQAERVRLVMSEDPCATCYCPRKVHELKGILQADCGNRWPCFPVPDGGPSWLHCPCDGYRPMGE